MSAINVTAESFTCHQIDDMAIITIFEGANLLTTTVTGKERLVVLLETIRESKEIKGLAVMYSNKYEGDIEHKRFLKRSIEGKSIQDERRYSITYKNSLIQFLKMIETFPMPIVSGMNGDIGPTSFAINLAFDLRIATNCTNFVHPNLQLGLPSSPPLTLYLVRNLGPAKAAELLLTKPKFSSQEALDLGLITQVVSTEELENVCLDMLRQLRPIPGHAIAETRRMLHPDIDEVKKYLDAGFEGSLRSLYNVNV